MSGGEIKWDMKKCLCVVFLLAFFLGFLLWFAGGSWEEFYLGCPNCSNYWLNYVMK